MGPTPAELLAFARRVAADPAVTGSLPLDPEGRTWVRLEGPGGSEAWLVGWPPGTATGWHDHGGSWGAFATAAGTLAEQSLAVRPPAERRPASPSSEGAGPVAAAPVEGDVPVGGDTLVGGEGGERRLTAGQGRAFGPHHLHQVVNPSAVRHAVSVHAYYPALPLMRRYVRVGTVLRLDRIERPQEWA